MLGLEDARHKREPIFGPVGCVDSRNPRPVCRTPIRAALGSNDRLVSAAVELCHRRK